MDAMQSPGRVDARPEELRLVRMTPRPREPWHDSDCCCTDSTLFL